MPDAWLPICVGHVSNPPPRSSDGLIAFSPLIVVNDAVILATVPTNDACLSSGFGPRSGKMHEGIDLKARPASMVFSGGPGVIREVGRASGYGLNVVIDHGSGVSTRYAHFDRLEPDIVEGTVIGFGQALGMMGQSGNATAIHVHYEVLLGEWGARGVWDLVPTDPFSWPAYDPSGEMS
ncbi:MAG: M23 family metallopeptidase [Hyphomonadaceae bacterium]|nr:M23 family metallopeptidase [Hyphomonadaceae bacterium]